MHDHDHDNHEDHHRNDAIHDDHNKSQITDDNKMIMIMMIHLLINRVQLQSKIQGHDHDNHDNHEEHDNR